MQLFISDRVRLSPSFGIRINFLLPMLQITVPQVIMCSRLGQQPGTLLGGCGTFVSWILKGGSGLLGEMLYRVLQGL